MGIRIYNVELRMKRLEIGLYLPAMLRLPDKLTLVMQACIALQAGNLEIRILILEYGPPTFRNA